MAFWLDRRKRDTQHHIQNVQTENNRPHSQITAFITSKSAMYRNHYFAGMSGLSIHYGETVATVRNDLCYGRSQPFKPLNPFEAKKSSCLD